MGTFIMGILVAVGFFVYGGNSDRTDEAIGDILRVHNVAETGLVNGAADFGVRAKQPSRTSARRASFG